MKKTFLGYNDIPVNNFYKILETSDLRWFYKKYNGLNKKDLKDVNVKILLKRYKKIFDDRVTYLNDYKSKEYYRKLIEVETMDMKLYRIKNIFNIIKELPILNDFFTKFVDDLKQEGFKFGKPIKDEEEKEVYLNLMKSKIRGFSTKLALLKIEYKNILKSNEGDKQNKFDLVREKIILKEMLPEQDININTTTLQEWDALSKRAKEKSDEHRSIIEKNKTKYGK